MTGIHKKLESRAKKAKKSCGILATWSKSIRNHVYWIAGSCKGNGDEVLAKWAAIPNHVANIHEGHHPNFPKCLHGDIDDRDWIQQG